MSNLLGLKRDAAHALAKAEAIVTAAESGGRKMTENEEKDYSVAMVAYKALSAEGAALRNSTGGITRALKGFFPDGAVVIDNGRKYQATPSEKFFSQDYAEGFFDYVSSNGQKMSAALYEGSSPAGGYAVPVTVDGQVVPLAPTDMGVRTVANVIPTVMDIKIPRATTISTAAAKSEGTGSGANLFTESEPVLDQFTLTANMAGLQHIISWELAQDVPAFQSFAVSDMILAQSIFEENWFVNGTGTGQAQGLIGNVGTGTGVPEVADSQGNLLSIDATFNVMGTLKTPYHPNASWLLQRATAVELRKAQKQANLFEPVFTRTGGQDYLHGYPVVYSTAMPAIAAGATPALFGDFKLGYVIGDRGGAGINVKILDQPRATEGLIVFLCYRRTDGRVRRTEAIQSIVLHS
jgi:HK97 family phage major capsid protein